MNAERPKNRLFRAVSAVCLLLALLVTAPAWSQARGRVAAIAKLDAELFPPELVMRFQREIGLTEKQAKVIVGAVSETQSQMVDVQWKLSPELKAMRETVSQQRINEEEVRERLGRIMVLESRAKELQLLLMVRVKNALTPEQQEQLKDLRPRTPPRRN